MTTRCVSSISLWRKSTALTAADGGTAGGEVVFTGTPQEMAEQGQTITAEYLRRSL